MASGSPHVTGGQASGSQGGQTDRRRPNENKQPKKNAGNSALIAAARHDYIDRFFFFNIATLETIINYFFCEIIYPGHEAE